MTTIGTIELITKIDTSGYKKGEKEINETNKNIASNSEGTADRTSSAWSKAAKIGIGAAVAGLAALTTGAVKAATASWQQVSSVEQATLALRAYEKDGNKVNKVLTDLIAYARSDLGVLFNRKDLFAAAQGLKLYGAQTDKLTDYVKIMSRSVGLGLATWDGLNNVIGRVGSTGKLYADDLAYLRNAGFKLDSSLSGTSITFEKLFSLLDEGIPVEALEGQAGTIQGLGVRIQTAFRGIGDAILGVDSETSRFVKGGLGDLIVGFMDELPKALKVVSKALKDIVPEVIGVATGIVEATIAIFGAFAPGLISITSTIISVIAPLVPRIMDVLGSLVPQVIQLGSTIGDSLARNFNSAFASAVDIVRAIQDRIGQGNYEAAGVILGEGIVRGLRKITENAGTILNILGDLFNKVDWVKVGTDIGKNIPALLLGLAYGLATFDLFGLIRDNWQTFLTAALLIMFSPAKLLTPITKLLTKLPLGKLFIRIFITPLRNLGEPIRDAVSFLFSRLGGGVQGALANISSIIRAFANVFMAPIRSVIDNIAIRIRFLPEIIRESFTTGLNAIRTIITTLWTVIQTIFTTIGNTIRFIMQPLSAFFTNLFTGIGNAIRGVMSPIGDFFFMLYLRIVNIISGIPQFIWNTFTTARNFITSIFGNVASWFGNLFSQAANAIRNSFGSIVGFFRDIWANITSIFGRAGTAVGDAIGGAFRSAINGVLNGAVRIINGFIRAINSSVGAINKIPGVNISRISELNVPQLAQGGIITAPTLAMVGEGREAEAVIPLSKLDNMLNKDTKSSSLQAKIEINLHMDGIMSRSKADERAIAKSLIARINEELRSKGQPQIGGGAI